MRRGTSAGAGEGTGPEGARNASTTPAMAPAMSRSYPRLTRVRGSPSTTCCSETRPLAPGPQASAVPHAVAQRASAPWPASSSSWPAPGWPRPAPRIALTRERPRRSFNRMVKPDGGTVADDGTKDGLAEAVFRRVAGTFMPVIIETMASDLSLEEKAGKVVQHYLEVFA